MIEALDELEVITLFVDNLEKSKSFYSRVFGLAPVFEDDVSSVMKLGSVMINVFRSSEAPTLVAPKPVGEAARGACFLLTIAVADVDTVCAQLKHHGVELLNGPIDRPWGRRTAAFADPAGHVWEVAQDLQPG
jgi:lactoylglutathione lyase